MRLHKVLLVFAMLFLASTALRAQEGAANSSSDDSFWVNYWAQPKIILFGQEEDDFYKNTQSIVFPWNDFENPVDASVLDANVQWLKDHPDVHFYVSGYASAEGTLVYNLSLSQQRADWVKQTLISRGIAENRMETAVGWGTLYPVCADFSQDCLAKNRLVRLSYAPVGANLVGQVYTAH